MRTIQFLAAIMAVSLFTNIAKANNPDSTKVEKKIIKTIIINDEGKTVTDSTFVYDGDNVKVHVNTNSKSFPEHKVIKHRNMNVPHGNTMVWTDNEDQTYNVTVDSDGDSSNVIIMKGPEGMVKHFQFRNEDMNMPHMMMFEDGNIDRPIKIRKEIKHQKSNLIDLNDPKIISFEKETLKNGNEKITIVRKTKNE